MKQKIILEIWRSYKLETESQNIWKNLHNLWKTIKLLATFLDKIYETK